MNILESQTKYVFHIFKNTQHSVEVNNEEQLQQEAKKYEGQDKYAGYLICEFDPQFYYYPLTGEVLRNYNSFWEA